MNNLQGKANLKTWNQNKITGEGNQVFHWWTCRNSLYFMGFSTGYPLAESEMAASTQINRINLSADKLGLEWKHTCMCNTCMCSYQEPRLFSEKREGRKFCSNYTHYKFFRSTCPFPHAILPFFVAKYDTAEHSQSTSYQDSVFSVLGICSTFSQWFCSHVLKKGTKS